MSIENQSIKKRMRDMFGENSVFTESLDCVKTAVKCKNGTFIGREEDSCFVWRGIPFAKPPVGKRRWKKPEPVEKSEDAFTAFYFGHSAIQTELESERASFYPQSEDCLYLNVWKNSADQTDKKPVMVFIHGGSYGWGGTSDPLYDGRAFVMHKSDIILVTIAYRIGITGFIDFSSVEGGEDYPDSANLGIYDQIEALRWIKENIAAFGGDPDNITVFGESAGGGSVSILAMIKEAKGLFKRIIAESGSVALTSSREECRSFTEHLLEESGKYTMSELAALSEDELRAVNEKVNEFNTFPMRDGVLIPDDAYEPYEKGESTDIDILVGTNANELNYWIGELGGIVQYSVGMPVKFENDLRKMSPGNQKRSEIFIEKKKGSHIWRVSEYYNEIMFRLPALKMAEEHSKHGGKSYVYYWTVPSVIPYYKACHAVELAYVFGNIEDDIYTGKVAEKEISDRIMDMWANFARTGDPSTPDIAWGQYDTEYRNTLIVGKKGFRVYSAPLEKQRAFLMPLIKEKVNPLYADLDYDVQFVKKGIIAASLLVAAVATGIYLLFRNDD